MSDTSTASPRPPLRIWQRALLVVSVVVMLAGGAWSLVESDSPQQTAGAPDGSGATQSSTVAPDGFLPTQPSPTPGDASDATSSATEGDATFTRWSPTVFKLGFSFFVGFAVGYALRIFFRMTLLVIGIAMIAMFALQYAGLLTIDWAAMQGHYESVTGWLGGQFESMRSFMTGQLPSAALGATGLFVGFRRR